MVVIRTLSPTDDKRKPRPWGGSPRDKGCERSEIFLLADGPKLLQVVFYTHFFPNRLQVRGDLGVEGDALARTPGLLSRPSMR